LLFKERHERQEKEMLANEFQQKQQQQAEEIREKTLPKQVGPKEHQEDTVIVQNILIGDETEIEEVIPYAIAKQEQGNPSPFSQIDNHIFNHTWNTKDFFEVRWDGRPHRIKPGQQRFFPRYLADHFAKNLIDFILIKREEKEKLTGLVKNRLERKKLYDQIIVDTAQYYNGDPLGGASEGLRVERQVQEMNSKAYDLGEAYNPALGYGTTDKPPEKVEEIQPTPEVTHATAKTQDDIVKDKSRQELMKEAKQLGIDVTPSMTKEQVSAAILNF
jgi:hypothetical protein